MGGTDEVTSGASKRLEWQSKRQRVASME